MKQLNVTRAREIYDCDKQMFLTSNAELQYFNKEGLQSSKSNIQKRPSVNIKGMLGALGIKLRQVSKGPRPVFLSKHTEMSLAYREMRCPEFTI